VFFSVAQASQLLRLPKELRWTTLRYQDCRRTTLGYLGNKSWSNLLASTVRKLTLRGSVYIAKQILQLLNSDLKVTTRPSDQKGFRGSTSEDKPTDCHVGCHCFAACLTAMITEEQNTQTAWHIGVLSISLAILCRVCGTNAFSANYWYSILKPSRSTFVLSLPTCRMF
jgi:hypothetical protein